MSTIKLRPYQEHSVNALFDYFTRNNGSPLVVLPTASGKSIVQAAFIQRALEFYPDEHFLLVSHVRELLQQNLEKLVALWPEAPVGVYSAGLKRREVRQITIAGIQSVYKKPEIFGDIGIMIVDEAHLVPREGNGMYLKFIAGLRAANPSLRVVGLTATHYRLDSGYLHEGDDRIFTDIAYETSVVDLVRDRYLCPLIAREGHAQANLSQVHLRGGEFIPDELEATMNTDALVKGACDEIVRLCAARKKWLIFCCGVAHAQHVCRELQERGVSAGCVYGDMPAEDRDRNLAAFRDDPEIGALRAITNMNVLTTGFDAPNIDALIMLRPTMSTGLYVQMVGRGMRLFPGKENTLVLDFAGNVMRHGPIDMVRVKKPGEGDGEAPAKKCPECESIVAAGCMTCPVCGHQFPPRKPKHDIKPDGSPILTDGSGIVTYDVDRVTYHRHCKPGKPDSLRVDYHCGLQRFSEWVCIEHGGYAGEKAEKWIFERLPSGTQPPTTVTEALGVASGFKTPAQIVVNTVGQYPRIMTCRDLEFIDEAIPF